MFQLNIIILSRRNNNANNMYISLRPSTLQQLSMVQILCLSGVLVTSSEFLYEILDECINEQLPGLYSEGRTVAVWWRCHSAIYGCFRLVVPDAMSAC